MYRNDNGLLHVVHGGAEALLRLAAKPAGKTEMTLSNQYGCRSKKCTLAAAVSDFALSLAKT